MENDPKYLVEHGYDRIAQRYLEIAQSAMQLNKPTARMNYLQKLLDRLPENSQVLELGCGAGVPCTQMLARQNHVTGVDISVTQIDLAKKHVPTARLVHADMMSLDFPPETFDAVVAFYSIIHLPRVEQTLLVKRLAGWLRPGGWFLTNLGTSDDPGSIEKDWLLQYPQNGSNDQPNIVPPAFPVEEVYQMEAHESSKSALSASMYWSSYDAQTNLDLIAQNGFMLVESEIVFDDENGEQVPFLWILAQKKA